MICATGGHAKKQKKGMARWLHSCYSNNFIGVVVVEGGRKETTQKENKPQKKQTQKKTSVNKILKAQTQKLDQSQSPHTG